MTSLKSSRSIWFVCACSDLLCKKIFQKLEQKVRQDLFFCGREESERRERERARARRMCRGHRSSATGDKLSTRAVTD